MILKLFTALLPLAIFSNAVLFPDQHKEEKYAFPFNTNSPDASFELPNDLFEVSGLSVSEDGQHLVAIQDENGIIYRINPETGAVEHQFEFWKDGDYEGVEVVGNDIYVVKSTGTIYKIKNPDKENQEVIKYKYFLDKDNDVEGLAYDAKSSRLLLACKAKAGTGEHYNQKKGIYAFDYSGETMDTIPAFTVSLVDIIAYLKNNPDIPNYDKLEEFFIRDDGKFKFSPSAIAIHPFTGDIYITSSVGKLMVVLNAEGQLLYIE